VIPLLEREQSSYENSSSTKDRRYYVPSKKKGKFAERTDLELKKIYNGFRESGLYETFLVNAVAKFEWFLADALSEYFTHYPIRISEKHQGIPPCAKIEVNTILESEGKEQLIKKIIDDHVSNVFRQRPSIYMSYFSSMLSCQEDPSFLEYYEISATRDLVVHNGNIANELYLSKSGDKARAVLGGRIEVNEMYFSECIANMKRVSGAIKRDVELKFGANKPNA